MKKRTSSKTHYNYTGKIRVQKTKVPYNEKQVK